MYCSAIHEHWNCFSRYWYPSELLLQHEICDIYLQLGEAPSSSGSTDGAQAMARKWSKRISASLDVKPCL